MPKHWKMSDEIRSEMAVAAIDARVHVSLALEKIKARAKNDASREIKEIGGYLSHAHSTLNLLADALRNRLTAVNGDDG